MNQYFYVYEMSFYSDLLNKAIKSIKGEEESKAVQMMFDFGGFKFETK